MALVWSQQDDEYFEDDIDDEEEPWELDPSLTDSERNPTLAEDSRRW